MEEIAAIKKEVESINREVQRLSNASLEQRSILNTHQEAFGELEDEIESSDSRMPSTFGVIVVVYLICDTITRAITSYSC